MQPGSKKIKKDKIMNWIHEDLRMGFKVILTGDHFPPEYQNNDRLDIYNGHPEDGWNVLIKRNGRHEIHKYYENNPEPWNTGELIGSIDSLERKCNEDCGVFLGDNADRDYTPAHCSGCSRLEIVEEGVGNRADSRYSRRMVRPCCMTGKGLKPINGWPYFCSDPVRSTNDEETS
jgi:hypothetical protein